jgi:hypothetical protein
LKASSHWTQDLLEGSLAGLPVVVLSASPYNFGRLPPRNGTKSFLTVYGVTTKQKLPVPEPAFENVWLAADYLWLRGVSGAIWRWGGSSWEKVAPSCEHVKFDFAPDGSLWCIEGRELARYTAALKREVIPLFLQPDSKFHISQVLVVGNDDILLLVRRYEENESAEILLFRTKPMSTVLSCD